MDIFVGAPEELIEIVLKAADRDVLPIINYSRMFFYLFLQNRVNVIIGGIRC